jgi:Flp pilus assembly protein TadG
MIAFVSGRVQRRGAAIVEMAFVLPLALIVMMAIFEYGRYLMVLHVADNAAREGARFAVVNTNLGSSTTPVVDVVNTRMAGIQSNLQSYAVTVFTVDPTGLYDTSAGTAIYPPTIRQKPGSNWNDAKYGGGIAVQITGTYTPLLGFLPTYDRLSIPIFNASVSLTVTAMMNSEAN